MRIVIDLQGAQTENRFRGIGRYSMAFALAIARNAGNHEIWLVLNAAFPESILDIRQAFDGIIPDDRIRIFQVPAPVAEIDPANAWRMRAAEKIREHFIQQLQPDVVLISSLFEGFVNDAVTSIDAFSDARNTAVILYDLIPLRNPAVYLPTHSGKQHYERKIAALKNAGLLLAISDYSRQDAIETLDLADDSVISIGAAIEPRFKPQPCTSEEETALRSRYGITRKMVMYAPGGFDARKNFEGLIHAYALLPPDLRAAHQLVVVSKITEGDRAHLMQLRKQAGIDEYEFVLTGYVSDADLVALYNLATLFVFPSKHEGFGLPALEAMACGAPTIGSNTTSMPQVIGWEEAMFDPASPHSIAGKMAQILGDEDLRIRLGKHGLSQAAKFSWDASAKRAISEFESRQSSLFRNAAYSRPTVARSEHDSVLNSIAEIRASHEPLDIDLVAVASAVAFNTSADVPRQLLIDISEIVQRDAKSGIQRVVRSILLELLNNAPDGYVVRPIYYDGNQYRHATAFAFSFLGNTQQESEDEIAEFNQYDVYLGLDLNAHLARELHLLYTRLQYLGVKVYFVVYDILLVQRPDWWHEGTSVVFEEWLRSITQVATGLVCISDAVADDVRAWLSRNEPACPTSPVIGSFHLGADVASSLPTKGLPHDANAVLTQLKAKPSFLTVGTLEPRKGHAQTLAAFELLWSRNVDANLVIVGKQGWLVDTLISKLRCHAENGRRLFWLEGISDEYLENVYDASICLIAPSEGEGFGLPLIEAAQHKRPIIARDLPVFREVAGDHAFYFNGLDPLALASAVEEWLTLNSRGLAPQSVNMPWLTWRQSVHQLLARILPIRESTR